LRRDDGANGGEAQFFSGLGFMFNFYLLKLNWSSSPHGQAIRASDFQADDEGSIPFTRSKVPLLDINIFPA
jgi:hypothetical protein